MFKLLVIRKNNIYFDCNHECIMGKYYRISGRRILRSHVYTTNRKNVPHKTCPGYFYFHTSHGYCCFWINFCSCMYDMVSFSYYWLRDFHYHPWVNPSLQIKVGLTNTYLRMFDIKTIQLFWLFVFKPLTFEDSFKKIFI